MSDLGNIIGGPMPHRPNTKDFWRMSEILLHNDSAIDEVMARDLIQNPPFNTERDAVWHNLVEEHVDVNSVIYVATQRAMRPLGIVTAGQLMQHAREVGRMSTLWIDGFVVGSQFQKQGGHQDG